MCGIAAYVGRGRPALAVLLDGLRRLEYRGYDSAGVAICHDGDIALRRAVGKLAALEGAITAPELPGRLGIGHTRWATHGPPTLQNAHPHRVGDLALVHNGIVENDRAIRERLTAAGRVIASETDSELIAHLVDEALDDGADLLEAARRACAQLVGSSAFAVISAREGERIVAAKQGGSPLILGLGEKEQFLASDIPALLPYTRRLVFLEDGDFAAIDPGGYRIVDAAGEVVTRPERTVAWDPVAAEKGGYDRFMQKEIFEQPRAITATLGTRLDPSGGVALDELGLDAAWLRALRRVHIVACGSAYHAGLLGKYAIERFARLPVEVEIASEYRYRDPLVDERVLLLAISQSGETADTLAALREGRERGARALAICNTQDASIPRASDLVLYTHAGPEIGVASTKTFTTQVVALYLLALQLGTVRETLAPAAATAHGEELRALRRAVERALQLDATVHQVARDLVGAGSVLYLGRGPMHPVALEGALKLKEISYLHAEGYPAGELKHGPIALIDGDVPVIALAPQGRVYDKISSNLQEVRARGGRIIAIASEGDRDIAARADRVLYIPALSDLLTALVAVIPLQLLAYHVAVLKGTDVDQPRNLAKSVTVE